MQIDLLSSIWSRERDWSSLTPRQWELLIGQARQASLLSRLGVLCGDDGWLDRIPAGPRHHLEGAMRLADRQQHEVFWEVNRIMSALKDVDVPVVLLKGSAYLTKALPPSRGRVFSDIDIMVPQQKIAVAEAALLGAGWISDERDAYNQRYYRQWMHEIPPLRHVQRNTYIDLHHTITPPTSHFNVDGGKLFAQAVSIDNTSNLFVLSPQDMVLHSAVHLFQEGEFGNGLRDLLDMNGLLKHFSEHSETFWSRLLDRAEELRLQVPLFYALFHVQRLFFTALPQQYHHRLDSMRPHRFTEALMAWALELALRPMHPSCNSRWTKLARWALYVRAHALRMPPQLVAPHLVRKAWMRRFPEKTQ